LRRAPALALAFLFALTALAQAAPKLAITRVEIGSLVGGTFAPRPDRIFENGEAVTARALVSRFGVGGVQAVGRGSVGPPSRRDRSGWSERSAAERRDRVGLLLHVPYVTPVAERLLQGRGGGGGLWGAGGGVESFLLQWSRSLRELRRARVRASSERQRRSGGATHSLPNDPTLEMKAGPLAVPNPLRTAGRTGSATRTLCTGI